VTHLIESEMMDTSADSIKSGHSQAGGGVNQDSQHHRHWLKDTWWVNVYRLSAIL